jgi:hypothetical protein
MAKISIDRRGIDEHVLQLLIPQEILECFELNQIVENESEVLFDLGEKEKCVPHELRGETAVLNGYLNATTLQSFSQKGKRCYIHLLRRRWKEKGILDNKSYNNEYEFTAAGTMATKSFGAFLKRNSLIPTPSLLAQSLQ